MVYGIDIWWPLLEFGALLNIKVLLVICIACRILVNRYWLQVLAVLFTEVSYLGVGLIIGICVLTP